MIERPTNLNSEYYFTAYVNKAKGEDLIPALRKSGNDLLELIKPLSEEQSNFKYAEGKWTIKQVIRHITDTERVFAYRALCMSRKDTTPLPGFNQDAFADHDNCQNISLAALKDEFVHVRNATIALFKTMAQEALDYEGMASNLPMTARILGWTNVGHLTHHLGVIEEMYLAV